MNNAAIFFTFNQFLILTNFCPPVVNQLVFCICYTTVFLYIQDVRRFLAILDLPTYLSDFFYIKPFTFVRFLLPTPKSDVLLGRSPWQLKVNLASNYTCVFTLFLTSVQDSNLTWDESGRNISHCPKMKMNDKKPNKFHFPSTFQGC